MTYH